MHDLITLLFISLYVFICEPQTYRTVNTLIEYMFICGYKYSQRICLRVCICRKNIWTGRIRVEVEIKFKKLLALFLIFTWNQNKLKLFSSLKHPDTSPYDKIFKCLKEKKLSASIFVPWNITKSLTFTF